MLRIACIMLFSIMLGPSAFGQSQDSTFFSKGLIAYNNSDDALALDHFNKAIQINKDIPDYHFYSAMCNLYLKEHATAEIAINIALKLKPEHSLYLIAKGDIYYDQDKLDRALEAYQQASRKQFCDDRAFVMISQIYADQGSYPQAIKSYKETINKIDPFSPAYVDCLFNLSMIYIQVTELEEAVSTLNKLVELRPLDFEVMAKLVQCENALNNYQKADSWKNRIYKGYEDGLLPPTMKDMFCFDQFTLNGQKILGFEFFQEPEDSRYFKHVFYVVSPEGDIKYSIQTEHSMMVSALNKQYVLGKTENGGHSAFFEYLFEEGFEYAKLKNAVIDVIDKH